MQTFQQPLTKNEEEYYLGRLQEEDEEKKNEAKQILAVVINKRAKHLNAISEQAGL